MREHQAKIKPTLAQAGGSDHVKQSVILDIAGQGIKVDTHNMLEPCKGRNNAFGETETPGEYKARLDFLSTQYAYGFSNGTDVLMLQEAPPTEAQAKEMFETIQGNTSTPLAFFYATNSTGQGMMTIYNPTVVKPTASQKLELNQRVQTTHFEIGGREVTFKNVHAKFEMVQPSEANHLAAKQAMEALMQGKPGELIIRGGDHNGGQDFYPDLKFASTGGMATSGGYDRQSRTPFTRDERTGVPKQYDGFAINDSAVAFEAQYYSDGALSLNQNSQITLHQVQDIGVPQPTAYALSKEGLIQLEFPIRQDASLFAHTLAVRGITQDTRESIPSNDNNRVILTLTIQEAQNLAKSALVSPEELQKLNTIAETKARGGFGKIVGGIAGGIGSVAGGLFNRLKGALNLQPIEHEQENKQEHRIAPQQPHKIRPAAPNEGDFLPEPIACTRGRTGLIQLKFNNDNKADVFAEVLHELKIASNQYGNGPKASRDSIVRLTAQECQALLKTGFLSQKVNQSLTTALTQHNTRMR